ncbi:hypothetical protein AGLY_009439 [Aphis glycines]|uniref:MULE transposase domain-containing protein n=1 Tax=Aphis glycines TaxID=307491 RepID=A0A6G0TI21_APHGL|nr:hypothetical protein AGLY_009439 [Aphis glycines]
MEFVESKRGKMMLIFDGFKYVFGYTSQTNVTRWRCFMKNCRANIFEKEKACFLSTSDHGDNCSVKNIDRQKLATTCKRKAVNDICQRPRKIILGEINDFGVSSIMTTNDISALRKRVYRARHQILLMNPKCIADIHSAISSVNTLTTNDEEFSLLNDEISNIIIFSYNTNLKMLCKSEIIYVDGTFSYYPSLFTQLFTIHGLVNTCYIPLVFCLLLDKKTESYKEALFQVVQKCLNLNLIFKPQSITVDFEIAIHQAVLLIWPSIVIVGCRFHLIQSWNRKIQELGLTLEYKKNDWLKHTFGLTFLDPLEVSDCFSFDLMSDIPDDSKYSKYADYILENYIDENSKFPPNMWATHSATLNRTTNNCESFHSHFNQTFYKTHPSFFTFLQILKDTIQTDTYIKINSAQNNIKKISKNKKILNRVKITEDAITKKKIE